MLRQFLISGIVILTALGVVLFIKTAPKRPASQRSGAGETSDLSAARSSAAREESHADAGAPHARAPQAKRGASLITPPERAQLEAAMRRVRAKQNARTESPDDEPADLTLDEADQRREEVRKQIAEVTPLLAECYELERARQPALSGSLRLRFTIDGEPGVGGIVTESMVVGGSLADETGLGRCITETIYTVKFAPPEHGGRIDVEYPFVFDTDGSSAAK